MALQVAVSGRHSNRWADAVLDLLFPRVCVGCGARGEFICPSCTRQLAPIGPCCPGCGKPQAQNAKCPACWARHSEIDSIRSPYRFQGTAREAVHAFKYRRVTALARPLAALLAGQIAASPVPADVYVPVPLHSRRLRRRGYNQSALLATELGRLTGTRVDTGGLRRVRDAGPQVRARAVEERRANVAGAFACADDRFNGLRVVVIDDVCTSGATLEACAAALRRAGASSVAGVTFAREV